MLAHPQLPPGLIDRCLDVLKQIMPSERDLIRVIVEIVIELREGEEDAENAEEPPVRLLALPHPLVLSLHPLDRRQPIRHISSYDQERQVNAQEGPAGNVARRAY